MKQLYLFAILPLFLLAIADAASEDPQLRDKTLVAWVAPANLTQQGGSRLQGNAKVVDGKLVLDGSGYLWAAKDAKLLTIQGEEETPFDAGIQTLFYKARSKQTGNMWDTWLYLHQGNEGEVGAIERIGDRYYMMFGTHPTMVTLVADQPEGPFVAARKNFCLLAGHTYFSRFFPTPDGVLVNHHSIARDGQVYFGTLKSALLDDAGTLRLGWWKGNDKLKEEAVAVKPPALRPGELPTVAMIEPEFDPRRGLILEGTLKLPASKESPPVGIFLAQGNDSGTAILVHAGGIAELGPMRADGTGFKAEDRIDREWPFGPTARFRLLLKGSLIEFYLEDLLIDCYSLPQGASGRIGILPAGDPAALTALKAWCP